MMLNREEVRAAAGYWAVAGVVMIGVIVLAGLLTM
jgi:hypothetical protein